MAQWVCGYVFRETLLQRTAPETRILEPEERLLYAEDVTQHRDTIIEVATAFLVRLAVGRLCG